VCSGEDTTYSIVSFFLYFPNFCLFQPRGKTLEKTLATPTSNGGAGAGGTEVQTQEISVVPVTTHPHLAKLAWEPLEEATVASADLAQQEVSHYYSMTEHCKWKLSISITY